MKKPPQPCKFFNCPKFCVTTQGGGHKFCREHNRQFFGYIESTCIDCNVSMRVRRDALKTDSGRCRRCANKETANRPEVKSAASTRARIQVLAQGGIPNAVKITSDTWPLYFAQIIYKPLSAEQRLRRRQVVPKGSNHHRWKGGITKVSQKIRQSLEYKLWREAVFTRDNWTCVLCGTRSAKGVKVYLQADHIKPFSEFPELRFEVNNGRTLCKPCHKATDTYGYKQLNRLLKIKRAMQG